MNLERKFLASKQTGFWNNVDSYLQRFTKHNKKLIDTNYEIEPRKFLIDYYTPSVPDAMYILQFRDGSNKNKNELAILSFNFDERDVVISQIQATHINKERVNQVLSPLKWERMLVSMLEDWSFQNSVANVRIVPAERNIYWNRAQILREGLSLEEHQHNLRMRYDVTAKRSGFQYDKEMQVWSKPNPNITEVAA